MKICKNIDVIENYFNNINSRSHDGNLYTRENGNAWELVNYYTPLVRISKGVCYINTNKYSRTTSKIQTYIKRELEYHKYKYIIKEMEEI